MAMAMVLLGSRERSRRHPHASEL